MKIKKILITGGAGFLGQHLISSLNNTYNKNIKITVIDKTENPHPFIDINKFSNVKTYYDVNITNYSSIGKFFLNQDIVFHLAGLVSFYKKDKNKLFKINASGTENVLKASLKNKIKKVIHISSVAGIGYLNDSEKSADEKLNFPWHKIKSKYYMLSKHKSELIAKQYIKKGLPVIIINPGLMYGPGDYFNSIKLIKSIYNDKLSFITPGGTNVVDVRDVVKGLVKLISKNNIDQQYIFGGNNYTFKEITKTIANALNKKNFNPKILSYKWRNLLYPLINIIESISPFRLPITADLIDSSFKFRYFSSKKAQKDIGYKITIPLLKTFKDTINWYVKKVENFIQ